MSDPDAARQQLRRVRRWRVTLTIIWLSGITVCVVASGVLDLSWLANLGNRLAIVASTAWPPDASRLLSHWAGPLGDTLVMSVAATAIGMLAAIPLGMLAARGLSPHRLIPLPVRSALGGMRTVPELLLALLLVIAVGPGMVAGTLALAIHSAGMLGKFYQEALERAQPEPRWVVLSSGANRLQTILYGVLPQVMPQLADATLFRWECNLRAAVVLGIIGAGGIGQELIVAQRMLRYDEVVALVLVILVMVLAVDIIAGRIRRLLV